MKLGVPSVVAVTERFEELARRIAESREVPDFPMVILPSDVEQMSDSKLVDIGQHALDEAVEALAESGEGARGGS
jgi:hypothetical protein